MVFTRTFSFSYSLVTSILLLSLVVLAHYCPIWPELEGSLSASNRLVVSGQITHLLLLDSFEFAVDSGENDKFFIFF